MDFTNKQTIICYIDTNKIIFFQGLSGALLELNFPQEVISHLDLLHKEAFENLIESFITQNQIIGDQVVIVYSPQSAFEKNLEEQETRKDEEEIQKFIDMVPFEDVLSKTYRANKKIKVVAINGRLHESIKNVFNKKKFQIYAAIPSSILQENFSELRENIDLGFILKRLESIKQYSMVNGSAIGVQVPEVKPEAKKNNKRLYILGGIFGALLVILIIMVITILLPQKSSPSPTQTIAPPLAPRPTSPETSQQGIAPTAEQTTTSSATVTNSP